MTPEEAIRYAYRPHDPHTENRLIGSSGLTAMEITQAFYGVKYGREFLVNFLAEHAQPGTTIRDRQTWSRPAFFGADRVMRAESQLHLEVDEQGRARVHEAVLAQLLVDAGWERTA